MKYKLLFCLLTISLFVGNVSATELNFYTNENGVSFTEKEYNFLSDFYFDGYQDYMTTEDYEKFVTSNIMEGEIKTITLDDSLNSRSLEYETKMKQLKVSSSCANDCIVATTLIWKAIPAVKSYDLIGAYFDNTSLADGPSTYLLSGTTYVSPSYTLYHSNGISASIKIPNTNNSMKVVQQFNVKKSGSINVSYQHARKSISLTNSKKYKLSRSGYGGVFDFNESISNYYDAMGGITLNLV